MVHRTEAEVVDLGEEGVVGRDLQGRKVRQGDPLEAPSWRS